MAGGPGRQTFVLPAVLGRCLLPLLLKVLLFAVMGRVALPPGFFVPCRGAGWVQRHRFSRCAGQGRHPKKPGAQLFKAAGAICAHTKKAQGTLLAATPAGPLGLVSPGKAAYCAALFAYPPRVGGACPHGFPLWQVPGASNGPFGANGLPVAVAVSPF